MKKFILISLFLAACGTQEKSETESAADKCSSDIVGVWNGTKDKITIAGDESFTYLGDDNCQSYGTYFCPTVGTTRGTLLVTIKSATASAYCNQAGSYQCSFETNNNTLAFYCTNTATGKASTVRSYKK